MGNLNHQAALTATGKECYEIGKYASENGTTAACRKFKLKFNIREKTVLSFKNKYEQMIKSAKRKKRNTKKSNQREKTRSTHLSRRD